MRERKRKKRYIEAIFVSIVVIVKRLHCRIYLFMHTYMCLLLCLFSFHSSDRCQNIQLLFFFHIHYAFEHNLHFGFHLKFIFIRNFFFLSFFPFVFPYAYVFFHVICFLLWTKLFSVVPFFVIVVVVCWCFVENLHANEKPSTVFKAVRWIRLGFTWFYVLFSLIFMHLVCLFRPLAGILLKCTNVRIRKWWTTTSKCVTFLLTKCVRPTFVHPPRFYLFHCDNLSLFSPLVFFLRPVCQARCNHLSIDYFLLLRCRLMLSPKIPIYLNITAQDVKWFQKKRIQHKKNNTHS